MNTPHQHDARCKELFAMLSEYVDGELPVQTCDEIEAHFAGCPPCVEFIANFKKTIALTREMEPEPMPVQVAPERRAELEQAWRQALARRA